VLADELGIEITVCHVPPGTSKWNKIGNYSPPFWEIQLDTVTAESPTGEG
jgi:Rhodopirellula transposase DDE domain